MRKLLISVVCVAVVFGLVFSILSINKDHSVSSERRSNEVLLSAITNAFPEFTANEKAVIEIDSVSLVENKWYIATIKSLQTVDKFVPVKVVLLDNGNSLEIIAGPDIYFTESVMLSLNLPDSVILELQKS